MIVLTDHQNKFIISVEHKKLYAIVNSKIELTSSCKGISKQEANELGELLKPLMTSYKCDLTDYLDLLKHCADQWKDLPIVCTLSSYDKNLNPVELKIKGTANILNWFNKRNMSEYKYTIGI